MNIQDVTVEDVKRVYGGVHCNVWSSRKPRDIYRMIERLKQHGSVEYDPKTGTFFTIDCYGVYNFLDLKSVDRS